VHFTSGIVERQLRKAGTALEPRFQIGPGQGEVFVRQRHRVLGSRILRAQPPLFFKSTPSRRHVVQLVDQQRGTSAPDIVDEGGGAVVIISGWRRFVVSGGCSRGLVVSGIS